MPDRKSTESPQRLYAPLLAKARSAGSRDTRMKRAVDALWNNFSAEGQAAAFAPDQSAAAFSTSNAPISWIGFYLKTSDKDEMVLAAMRDKPACSPIGLHGVCGRCWRERRPIIVPDVKSLGENYIACDPRDRSELVIPLLESDGTCWGVLDADSYHESAFNEHDARGMQALMERLGLTIKGGPCEPLVL